MRKFDSRYIDIYRASTEEMSQIPILDFVNLPFSSKRNKTNKARVKIINVTHDVKILEYESATFQRWTFYTCLSRIDFGNSKIVNRNSEHVTYGILKGTFLDIFRHRF